MPTDSQLPLRALPVPPPPWAKRLGYGGLLPFVGLGLATWVLEDARQSQAVFALLAYGGTILSFLGAIHWGLALRDRGDPPVAMLAWGVVPSLLAWVALLWGASGGLWLLAAGLAACWVVDRSVYPRFGLEGWLGMRRNLTVVASLMCVAASLAPLRQA
ncbi:DUF3429 domain-containing protein [soil metagenome]